MLADFPTVSVIIPAYGRPDFLSISIDSALQQTLKPCEIIVVDDCSPADLSPIVKQYGSAIRYDRLTRNRGANGARNHGVGLAVGELVAFLDDDDIWFPDKLERQVALLTSRPGAEACLCGWKKQDKPGNRKHRQETRVHQVTEVRPDLLFRGNVFCGMSGLVARREVLLSEPFDEDLPNGQDWDMYIRLSKRTPIAYVPAALFMYRFGIHESISLANKSETLEQTMKRLQVIEKHRDWMGERHYRDRLAVYILRFIGSRKNILRIVLYSLRRAGFRATMKDLWSKTLERLRIG